MRTSASRVPACVIFDNLCKQFVPLDQTFLPQCVEGTSKVLLIRFPQRFFLEGGEILREINGQDHQTSMAKISASICSIWSRSLRSSECIENQWLRHQPSKIIKIQNNEFSDRPRKCTFCSRTLHMANDASLKSPLLNKGCHTS